VTASARQLRGARFSFSVTSVTGTENALMAAALAKGTSRLEGCACEPEITDLADLLRSMGAHISGDGTSTIEIEGVDSLAGASHRVIADRIEVGTYLIGAALTAGEVTVQGAPPEALSALLEQLAAVGAEIETGRDWIAVARRGDLVAR